MRKYILLLPILIFLAGCSSSDELLNDVAKNEKSSAVQSTDKTSAPQNQSQTQSQVTQQTTKNTKPMFQQPPSMQIDKSKKYTAALITDKGNIAIELFAAEVPITVNNFVFLASQKFYDGVIFHRTMKDFMIQTGDPTGTGAGGPGYKFADEKFDGEYTRGTVAMANAGPNTNGSQFFIMHKDVALPKNYVIFGKVVAGMDVVDAIATAPVKAGASGESSTPVQPVVMQSVQITAQ